MCRFIQNICLALAVLLTLPVSAQDTTPTPSPSRFHWEPGLQVGSPEAIAASIGAAYFEEAPGGRALFAKVTAGLNGARISVGAIATTDVGLGFEATAFVARTWRNPWTLPTNATLLGTEASILVLFARPYIGAVYQVSSEPSGPRFHAIAGLGIMF
jgi:hypothetical protein